MANMVHNGYISVPTRTRIQRTSATYDELNGRSGGAVRRLRVDQFGWAIFRCPGCNTNHRIHVSMAVQMPKGADHPIWEWNGNDELPTITPSIRVWAGVYKDGQNKPYCCHSFIKDGKIQFLGDCTHYLVGQTVDLPEMKTNAE